MACALCGSETIRRGSRPPCAPAKEYRVEPAPQVQGSSGGRSDPILPDWVPPSRGHKALKAILDPELPGFAINIGGSSSIDITRKGVDKGYAVHRLAEATGLSLADMLFLGDAIFPGGERLSGQGGGRGQREGAGYRGDQAGGGGDCGVFGVIVGEGCGFTLPAGMAGWIVSRASFVVWHHAKEAG